MSPSLRDLYNKINEFNEEFLVSKWRSGLQKEANRQQDALMAILFMEALGVPNPKSYYALSLYPEFVEEFHQWHRRMGMETFPDTGFCC
ncbi:MAG: hypothetical protein M3M97_01005 [Actinomycetota bacterium]|nr:hypothetical protein [Actinomycetota bacterium]